MDDKDDQLTTLLWVLDRQNSDYTDARGQLRRYLLVAIPIGATAGLSYFLNGLPSFLEPSPGYLSRWGLLWQFGVMPPKSARFFANVASRYGSTLTTVGAVLILSCLVGIYQVEKLEGCIPSDNIGAILEVDTQTIREWIDENDEILATVESIRSAVLQTGEQGIKLLASTIAFLAAAQFSPLFAFAILVFTLFLYREIHRTNKVVRGSYGWKVITVFIIYYFILAPLIVYQDVYGSLSNRARILGIGFAICANAYYLRSEIQSAVYSIREHAAGWIKSDDESEPEET